MAAIAAIFEGNIRMSLPPTISREVILNLIDLGGDDYPELLKELFSLFVTESTKVAIQMKKASEEKDWKSVSFGLHRLKSSCANVGGMEASHLSGALEQEIREQRLDQVDEKFENVMKHFEQVISAVESMLTKVNRGEDPM